ncbi:hypothetical protein pipiens_019666, partial [Culex pipiens pipiens]
MASSSHGDGMSPSNWWNGEETVTYLQLLPKNRGSLLPKNPFIVSKSIQQHCGKIDNAYVEGKGTSMVLKVRGKRQVTALLKLTKLIDGTEIDILEHESKNQMRGVVSCGRSLDCTDEEILEGMKDQNVIARTCPKYIEEQEIAKIRQDQDVSFGEARRIFNAKHIQTYASTVNSESAVQQRLANAQKEESETVKALRQELAATKKALAELSGTLKELAQAKNA